MAKPFGGKYSPNGTNGTGPLEVIDDRQVDAAGGRSNLLFIPAVVLVATTFSDGPVSLITGLIGAGTLTVAAMLLREGLRAEAAYDLPTYIDISEWPAVLLYLAAGYLAWTRAEQLTALLLVLAMIAFFAAHARFLFTVPLAFVLIVGGTLTCLTVLPVTWKPK